MSSPSPADALTLELPTEASPDDLADASVDPPLATLMSGPVAHLGLPALDVISAGNEDSRRKDALCLVAHRFEEARPETTTTTCTATEGTATHAVPAAITVPKLPSVPSSTWDELWRHLDRDAGFDRIWITDVSYGLTSFDQIPSTLLNINVNDENAKRLVAELGDDGWKERPAPMLVAFAANGPTGVTAICIYRSVDDAQQAAATEFPVGMTDLFTRQPLTESLGEIAAHVDGRRVAFELPKLPFNRVTSAWLQRSLPMFVVREAERRRLAGE